MAVFFNGVRIGWRTNGELMLIFNANHLYNVAENTIQSCRNAMKRHEKMAAVAESAEIS